MSNDANAGGAGAKNAGASRSEKQLKANADEADQKRRKEIAARAYVLLHEQWRTVHLAPWFKAPISWAEQKPFYEVVALEQLYRVFERC